MTYSDELTADELQTTVRILPACVCLDTSGSMSRDGKIESLNRAVGDFVQAVRRHKTASKAVRWEFVSFHAPGEVEITDHLGCFAAAGDENSDPVTLIEGKLIADGGTPMAEAIEHALELLDDEIADHGETGTKIYKPWLVLMTDGLPTSDPAHLERMIEQLRAKAGGDRATLVVIAVGIGPDADREFLRRLSQKREPDMIGDADIEAYFDHLSGEIIRASEGAVESAERFSTTSSE